MSTVWHVCELGMGERGQRQEVELRSSYLKVGVVCDGHRQGVREAMWGRCQ